MKAVIFNSGLGRRMGKLTENQPKCMARLYNGESIFERQIRLLSEAGIKEFVVTTGPFKEKIYETAAKFTDLNFQFVANEDYANTNYIVSMDLASPYMEEDILLLHGDLVFNKELVKKVLEDEHPSVCVYNEEKPLPEKDFKARFDGQKLREVSIDIFGQDCYAFQPFYKLSYKDLKVWKDKVAEFVKDGNTKVYAENALNTVSKCININGLSYKNDYIDEIDNEDDYRRVNLEIERFELR